MLADAADRLPIRVQGEAHWSVVRLDPTHVRVTLIDPGYLDPAGREVEVILQHIDAVSCQDILSRKTLPIKNKRISIKILMGTMRIVDIEHR